jgi:D-tyrosyl-tRNA(Tyr) deacylase
MRVVLQRVGHAEVRIVGELVGRIGRGVVLLVGIAPEDERLDLDALAKKIVELRIFPDEDGRMNLSLREVGGEILAVSQFTLLADTQKGRRPSFVGAARPEVAQPVFDALVDALRAQGVVVETGRFGAVMQVELTNDGPVTLVLDLAEPRIEG